MKENETFIPHTIKASNNIYLPKDLYISLHNKNAYNIHSGRLVEYSGTDSETEEAREQSPPAPSTPASPSPSPEQRRRNQQGETILNNFGSCSILYLLGESLGREESVRQSALQRIMHDAGAFRVRDTILTE